MKTTPKIYKKTFIKQSEETAMKIDDHLSFVEEGIGELSVLLRKLTKGNAAELSEQSKTNVSSYEDRLNRMSNTLSDLYSYKNDLLDDLEKMNGE